MLLYLQLFQNSPNAIGDITHDFDLGKIDGVNFCRHIVNVDNFFIVITHKEGRLFHYVVTDINN